ncbi:DUF3986 family protein [Metabacillus herbersteinensis]|uniref:DUF3986 family protein n=1 Tax=Metabacillus herbersteinensis TaxID=283816 RepID=A0ABV6GLN7_9BACI
MNVVYDSKYHLHIGYYEENYDYESIAYKSELEDVWDIFFDFKQYNIESTNKEEIYIENLGINIFSIKCKDLDYDSGANRFEKWLSDNNVI